MPVSPRAPVVELRSPWRISIFESRCRARIRSSRSVSRARTRSRSASSSGPGYPDRVQLAREQQPDEMLGVTTIGLHPVPGRARDLRRRRDHALHPPLRELAREHVPGRAGLVRDPDRPRQPSAEPGRRRVLAVHRKRPQLARLGVQHRRDDLRRVHVQTDEGSSLRHGWFLLCGCGPPRGVPPARHQLHPHEHRGGTGPSTAQAGQTDNPYGLCMSRCRRLPAETAPVRALGSGEGDRAAGPGLTIQIVAKHSSAHLAHRRLSRRQSDRELRTRPKAKGVVRHPRARAGGSRLEQSRPRRGRS